MQLTNFLRDVGEDVDRGRIYLPAEDMAAHWVREDDIVHKRFSPEFRELIRFEVCRAKKLYFRSDMGLPQLPTKMRKAVLIARLAYAQILDRIEQQDYNVFAGRARTTRWNKLGWAMKVALTENRIIHEMVKEPF